jgi:hypothetical protein
MNDKSKNLFKIFPTDQIFTDSPDASEPLCICSRCGKLIEEDDGPVRAWPEDESYEYRFHPACMGLQKTENDDLCRNDEDCESCSNADNCPVVGEIP